MFSVLRYGNTNTYFIKGTDGGILVDTDWAGTLPGFYRALKSEQICMKDIRYVLATHYHPDHMGLIPELMQQGVQLILFDVQMDFVHFPDQIFAKDRRLRYEPIAEENAVKLSCSASREFLKKLGIQGEVLYTPGHSEDSVSLLLDDGTVIVGDLDPLPYMEAYPSDDLRQKSWKQILAHAPRRVLYAHANEQILG